MPAALRRSARERRPTQRAQQAASSSRVVKKSRNEVPRSRPDGFLTRLYAEIHAHTLDPESAGGHRDMQDVIRRARTARFLALLDPALRDQVMSVLNGAKPTRSSKGAVQVAQDDLKVSRLHRLNEFCAQSGLVLLSICACSETFRYAINRDDDDSEAAHQPMWTVIRDRVKSQAQSLELFATTRQLDWNTAIAASDQHFALLFQSVFRGMSALKDVDPATFGVHPDDWRETQHLDRNTAPHEWFLPASAGPAARCEIDYIATEAIIKDPKRPAELRVGDKQTAYQQEIAQSMLIPGYDWPSEVKYSQDPAFCGDPDNPCWVCGAEQAEDRRMHTRTRRAPPPACDCGLADLRRKTNRTTPVLVELFETRDMGIGVRSLQDFKPGEYLAHYVGEIYPTAFNPEGGLVYRYEGLDAQGYTYTQAVPQLDKPLADIPHGDRASARKSRSKSSRQRPSRARRAPTPGAADRKGPAYTIDSALYGNWSRYINHSCEPNTKYTTVNLGQHLAVLIQTTTEIAFGDEVMISYGPDYFHHLPFGCKCGYASCRYWPEGTDDESQDGHGPANARIDLRPGIRAETGDERPGKAMTLAQAKKKGLAPRWAMENDAIPLARRESKTV